MTIDGKMANVCLGILAGTIGAVVIAKNIAEPIQINDTVNGVLMACAYGTVGIMGGAVGYLVSYMGNAIQDDRQAVSEINESNKQYH